MEERRGFIHDKLDIKLLILFILQRLPSEIDAERLADLVLIDGGIGYFDYKDCLAELAETAQIEQANAAAAPAPDAGGEAPPNPGSVAERRAAA